jgi:hypothetical protein
MRRLLAFLAVMGLCTGALACINDNESPQHEREFRSQYLLAGSAPPEPASSPLDYRMYVAAGMVLLIGASGIAFSRGQSRSKPCPPESPEFS